MKFVDVHAHLQFPEFDSDRAQVFERAFEAGVGVINVGTDLDTSRGAVELADQYADQHQPVWAIVGIHPTDLPSTDEEDQIFSDLEKLLINPRVVAVGECGLDYFRSRNEFSTRQKEIFIRQIHLANKTGKPLMLHLRGEGVYAEAAEILRSESEVPADIHFFSGNWAEAQKLLDLGCHLSFTGVVTFTRDYDEVVQKMPLDRLLVETDCPFVAPAPHRGQRNEPAYLPIIIEWLATIRGLNPRELDNLILENSRRFLVLS